MRPSDWPRLRVAYYSMYTWNPNNNQTHPELGWSTRQTIPGPGLKWSNPAWQAWDCSPLLECGRLGNLGSPELILGSHLETKFLGPLPPFVERSLCHLDVHLEKQEASLRHINEVMRIKIKCWKKNKL